MKKQFGGALTTVAIYVLIVAVGTVVALVLVIPAVKILAGEGLTLLGRIGGAGLFHWYAWVVITVIFVALVIAALPVLIVAWLVYLRFRGDREPHWRAVLIILGVILMVLLIASVRCFTQIPPWTA